MLFIMFDQVLAKERIQVEKIISNDMPERICSNYSKLMYSQTEIILHVYSGLIVKLKY